MIDFGIYFSLAILVMASVIFHTGHFFYLGVFLTGAGGGVLLFLSVFLVRRIYAEWRKMKDGGL